MVHWSLKNCFQWLAPKMCCTLWWAEIWLGFSAHFFSSSLWLPKQIGGTSNSTMWNRTEVRNMADAHSPPHSVFAQTFDCGQCVGERLWPLFRCAFDLFCEVNFWEFLSQGDSCINFASKNFSCPVTMEAWRWIWISCALRDVSTQKTGRRCSGENKKAKIGSKMSQDACLSELLQGAR